MCATVTSAVRTQHRACWVSATRFFDIALEEARNLPARVAILDDIAAPVLIVSVEDEVTGTGSLVQRLIFGVMEIDGHPTPMRDWELLQLLNRVRFKSAGGDSSIATTERMAAVDRLKHAFESSLSDHAPTLHRPVCWPEMLFVPVGSAWPCASRADENAA